MRSLTLLCPLFAAATLVAQPPGASYTPFGNGCAGSNGVPSLSSTGAPILGATFTIDVANLPPSFLDPAYLLLDFWPLGASIPLDVLGMPGCSLLVNPAILVALTKDFTTGYTTAHASLPLPNDQSLVGSRFYNQVFVVDQHPPVPAPWPNAFGATTSNAAVGVAGTSAELLTQIRGQAFYDIDESGMFDPMVPNEVALAGWKVRITANGMSTIAFTDSNGEFAFERPRDGTVHAIESIAPPPGFVGAIGGRWLPTLPAQVGVVADAATADVAFGNVFLVNVTAQVARSPGHWANSGDPELRACEPQWRTLLNGLCLRNNVLDPNSPSETLFTVSTGVPFEIAFAELRAYLLLPAHGVTAYVLSQHFCATNLNRECGPLGDGTIYVNRAGDGLLVDFQTIATQTLALLCDPRSANTGPQGDQAWRTVLQGCLNEWDGMNSESGDALFGPTEQASEWGFTSPY